MPAGQRPAVGVAPPSPSAGERNLAYRLIADKALTIDVRGLPPNRRFTLYATRGNDTIALLSATSNNMGVIPEALAFVAFFANNYDKVILRPV